VYDLKTGELHKHASDFGFTYVLPHGYFADAPAPLFEQFLKDVTQDNEDLATLIKEYIGYAMSNDEPWLQKCAVLIGTGANGKSVLVDTIAEIVGRHNTAGVFFKDLVKPEARMTLINKLMCISEETTVGAFQDSDVFKQLVTGGSILVKELYKQAYSATIKAKLFILCNEMPSSRDRTHGMFRRMMVIPFNAVFTKGDGKHDPDIKKKLMSEASGIFRTCMDAYASVRLRGGFTEPSASVDALARYIDENNPVHDFLEDECITVTGAQTDVVKVKEVYGAYVDYCKAAYLKPINNKFFGKMLLSADSRIQATRNTTSRLYTGVKLNKNF
jgi:putative DNA primase/helicase